MGTHGTRRGLYCLTLCHDDLTPGSHLLQPYCEPPCAPEARIQPAGRDVPSQPGGLEAGRHVRDPFRTCYKQMSQWTKSQLSPEDEDSYTHKVGFCFVFVGGLVYKFLNSSQWSWSDPRTETKLTLTHPGFMFLLLSACCPLWNMSCKTQFYKKKIHCTAIYFKHNVYFSLHIVNHLSISKVIHSFIF